MNRNSASGDRKGASRGKLRALPVALALGAVLAAPMLSGCSTPLTFTTVEEAQTQGAQAVQAQLSSPAIHEDGKLRIGLLSSVGIPEVVEKGGTYEGLDVNAGAALAQSLGLEAVYVPLDAANQAEAKQVDVVMGVDSSNAQNLVVVSSYLENAVGLFARGSEPQTPLTAKDLGGKTVGVQTGSASAQLLASSDLLVTQKGFDSLNDAFDALQSGSVDYVAAPAYPGGYLAHRLGDISLVALLDTPEAVGVGVASGNEELVQAIQSAMDKLSSGGVLALGRSQWVGDLPVLTQDLKLADVTFTDASSQPLDAGTGNGADPNGVSVPTSGATDGSTAGSNAVTDIPSNS